MDFASDNTAGIAPEVLDALAQANRGFSPGYGDDELTRDVERRFDALFERKVAVFMVPTGTAANAIALAHVSPPWGAVLCHVRAHILADECGAPEFFGAGLRLIGLPGEAGRLDVATVQAALDGGSWGGPHRLTPSALSLTQASEAGTLYQPDEVRVLAGLAHARGLTVHMDGARFANAIARLGVTPAEATWKAGVDVLSFGATKGGALAAEAVVFFDPARAAAMQERRKRAGHLLSKHRFLAAQFAAFLRDDTWLRLARHANAMADRLATGLSAAGLAPVWPVEANLLFVVLRKEIATRLKAAGAHFYEWPDGGLRQRTMEPDGVLVRLVTSFSTAPQDVERFLAIIRQS